MNINTGELRLIYAEQLSAMERGFTPVPADLQGEANKALGDKESVVVDLKGLTPLAKWAKKERHKAKAKNKARMAKASKRRNRG